MITEQMTPAEIVHARINARAKLKAERGLCHPKGVLLRPYWAWWTRQEMYSLPIKALKNARAACR